MMENIIVKVLTYILVTNQIIIWKLKDMYWIYWNRKNRKILAIIDSEKVVEKAIEEQLRETSGPYLQMNPNVIVQPMTHKTLTDDELSVIRSKEAPVDMGQIERETQEEWEECVDSFTEKIRERDIGRRDEVAQRQEDPQVRLSGRQAAQSRQSYNDRARCEIYQQSQRAQRDPRSTEYYNSILRRRVQGD
jgi:hypothetical protein